MSSGGRSSHWRRPVTKMYDYNYNLGEHYYRPQLNYVENRRAVSPPKARTFAERFAADPVYGSYGGPSYRYSRDLPAMPPPSSFIRAPSQEPRRLGRNQSIPPPKFMSMDDLRLDDAPPSPPTRLGGRKLFPAEEDNDMMGDFGGARKRPPRFTFGDRLLDATGLGENSPKTAGALLESRRSMDPFSDFPSNKKLGKHVGITLPSSADCDMEDPWKSTKSLESVSSARKKMDSMWNEMKEESEDSSSRFRSKIMSRRQQVQRRMEDSDDEDMLALTAKADKIQQRVKARLAQLEEDFPEVPIGMGGMRGRTPMKGFDDLDEGSKNVKSIRMAKRTMNASYEM